jgi:hypothetical protein
MLRGSRWDGTLTPGQPALGTCSGDAGNSFDEFSSEYIQFLRVFAETQMDVYENAAGPGGGSAGWVTAAHIATTLQGDHPRPSELD